VGDGPVGGLTAVVEHGLAVELDLHLAVDAADGAQQYVIGVVVGGGPPMGVGELVLVVPRADEQHVAHDDPACCGSPARLQHHGAGQVAAVGGHVDVGGTDPEAAGG